MKTTSKVLFIIENLIFVFTNARIRPRKVMLYWGMKEGHRKSSMQKELDKEHSSGTGIQAIDGKIKNYIPFTKDGIAIK